MLLEKNTELKKASGIWNSHAVGLECSQNMNVFPFKLKWTRDSSPMLVLNLSHLSLVYPTFSVMALSANVWLKGRREQLVWRHLHISNGLPFIIHDKIINEGVTYHLYNKWIVSSEGVNVNVWNGKIEIEVSKCDYAAYNTEIMCVENPVKRGCNSVSHVIAQFNVGRESLWRFVTGKFLHVE